MNFRIPRVIIILCLFLKDIKASVEQKWVRFKENQKGTVKKKLAQAAIAGMMQIDDTGAYMVNTNKIPQEFVPDSVNTQLLTPDSPDPEPHLKKPLVTISSTPPEPSENVQMLKDGKPIAEVRSGVISRPSAPSSVGK